MNNRLVETGIGPRGLGWQPDLPDRRDYTQRTDRIQEQLAKTSVPTLSASEVTKPVDLRECFTPVEDQETIGSCTANAAAGLYEYFVRKACGENVDVSRLFVYKVARNYLGVTGDTGAYLRTALGVLALFGAPPERYWPYDISRYEDEPTAFMYAFGQSFQALDYYRLDPPGTTADQLLTEIKKHLASGVPSCFGFTVYSSIRGAHKTGDIPYPSDGESVEGGHAIVAAGYDDNYEITNPADGRTTEGAFLIRNSWGTGWGDGGYGHLPYEYVRKGLAEDWWVLIKGEWLDTNKFNA